MSEQAADQAKAEQLSEQEDVRSALQFTATTKEAATPEPAARDLAGLGVYALLVLGLLSVYFLLVSGNLSLPERFALSAQHAALAAALVVLVMGVARLIEVYLIGGIVNSASRYNLSRLLHVAVGLAIIAIVLSAISNGWYTAGITLGLITVVAGIALREPITSFFGWLYIVGRQPYRVGDRIAIGDATGDVIDVDYLDTTLWEFHGPYLSTDHPSGRIIRLPNSKVLTTEVYNYSWALFPYIWQEVKLDIGYQSDLEFVARVMREVVEEEMGPSMLERVRVYRELLARTPVDQLEIQEHPTVHFRVGNNTWLAAIVRYVVHPKESGRVKTRLIRKLLERLNAEPEKVQFPKGDLR